MSCAWPSHKCETPVPGGATSGSVRGAECAQSSSASHTFGVGRVCEVGQCSLLDIAAWRVSLRRLLPHLHELLAVVLARLGHCGGDTGTQTCSMYMVGLVIPCEHGGAREQGDHCGTQQNAQNPHAVGAEERCSSPCNGTTTRRWRLWKPKIRDSICTYCVRAALVAVRCFGFGKVHILCSCNSRRPPRRNAAGLAGLAGVAGAPGAGGGVGRETAAVPSRPVPGLNSPQRNLAHLPFPPAQRKASSRQRCSAPGRWTASMAAIATDTAESPAKKARVDDGDIDERDGAVKYAVPPHAQEGAHIQVRCCRRLPPRRCSRLTHLRPPPRAWRSTRHCGPRA